jgi:hypothetical protein
MSYKTLLKTVPLAAILALTAPSIASAQGGNKQNTGQANFGNLISALNNINVEIAELNALNNLTVENVKIVYVKDLLNGNNVQALNNALNRNNVQILNLTNTLNNNTVIQNVLNNNNIAINRVIAIDVLSGGGVNLFVQEP